MTRRQKDVLIWVVTFIVMLIICLPGLWVVLSAFRSNGEILTKPTVWVPRDLTLDNFRSIFGFGDNVVGIPVGSYFWNSVVISVTSTAVAVVTIVAVRGWRLPTSWKYDDSRARRLLALPT